LDKGQTKILVIIPARGGSKGLPRKNVLDLAGKPLITWSIDVARACGTIDRIIVSTDDEEIASVAKAHGAEVPFMRPKDLALDNSTTISALFHAIDWLKDNQQYHPKYLLLLQPTSPLRSVVDIENVIEMFREEKVRSVVSVCKATHHPWLANTIADDGNMENFMNKEISNQRRQDFPEYYQLNGAIFMIEIDYLRRCNGFFGSKTYAYKMPAERSIDIDSALDLQFADFLIRMDSIQKG